MEWFWKEETKETLPYNILTDSTWSVLPNTRQFSFLFNFLWLAPQECPSARWFSKGPMKVFNTWEFFS